MTLASEIPSIIVSVITLIDHAYIYLISAFWYIATDYGLNPVYSFLQADFANASFTSLFSIFTGFYAQIVAIAVLASSMVFLFENSFFESVAAKNYVVRLFISIALIVFSFDIMKFILYILSQIFSAVWNGAGINWYSLSSIVGANYGIPSSLNLSSAENYLVEFFLLSALFLSVSTLFGILMIREAILLVLVVVLPFLSLLFLIPRLDSYTMKFWALFLQMSILPFIILVPLYLASLFPYDFPLQLALITAAGLMPVLFVTSSRIFSFGSIYSLLDSLNFQRTLDNLPLPDMRQFTELSGKNGYSTGNSPELSSAGTVDWSKVYSRDFDFSKYGGT